MKKLYLVRHAKSSWKSANQPDIERPLNKRGFRDAPRMAKILLERGDIPQKIIASSAIRTQTTAQIFAAQFQYSLDAIEVVPSLYLANMDAILSEIYGLSDDIQSVMIVAHNPTLTYLAYYFHQAIDNLPTCGIVTIEVRADKWSEISDRNAQAVQFDYPKLYFNDADE